MTETFLEPADTEEEAREKASDLAAALRALGRAGKWTVGTRKAPPGALRGSGGHYQVILFEEEE